MYVAALSQKQGTMCERVILIIYVLTSGGHVIIAVSRYRTSQFFIWEDRLFPLNIPQFLKCQQEERFTVRANTEPEKK